MANAKKGKKAQFGLSTFRFHEWRTQSLEAKQQEFANLLYALEFAKKIYTIEGKFLFLYKKLSTLLFQLYKTLPVEVGNQKHPVPFFLWDIALWFTKNEHAKII